MMSPTVCHDDSHDQNIDRRRRAFSKFCAGKKWIVDIEMYWNFGANDLIYIVPDPSAVPNGLYGSYSAFDQELKKLWQAASDQGVCRYQLQTSMIETKILPGKYNFVSKVKIWFLYSKISPVMFIV